MKLHYKGNKAASTEQLAELPDVTVVSIIVGLFRESFALCILTNEGSVWKLSLNSQTTTCTYLNGQAAHLKGNVHTSEEN